MARRTKNFFRKKFSKNMQKKLVMLFAAIILAFVFLVGRITYINAANGEDYTRIVLDQQQFSVRLLNVDLLRFDGILGWDLLRTMDFELDTIAGQMKVQKNRFRLDRPNLIPCSFPTLLLRETDGSVSLFGIDTGARQGWLGEGYIRRRGLQVLNSMRVVGFGVHGREEFETQIAKSVTLHLDRARITMEGCMSALVDILPDITYDGVLGNEVFAGRRIRFVNSAGMVLLT